MTHFVVVVQSLSCFRLFATPWTEAHQVPLSFTISWSLFKFMSIESVIVSNHLILCCRLLLLPSIFLASGSFSMNQLFPSGGQSIGASRGTCTPWLVAPSCTLKARSSASPSLCFHPHPSLSTLILLPPSHKDPSDHIQFSSVTQSCLTLCDPMDCSTPGFPVHH